MSIWLQTAHAVAEWTQYHDPGVGTVGLASGDDSGAVILAQQQPGGGYDVPNPQPGQLPERFKQPAERALSFLMTLGIWSGVGMMIIAGLMVIWGRRNNNNSAITGLIGGAWTIGGLGLVMAAPAIVAMFLPAFGGP